MDLRWLESGVTVQVFSIVFISSRKSHIQKMSVMFERRLAWKKRWGGFKSFCTVFSNTIVGETSEVSHQGCVLGKYPLDVTWEQNIKKWKRIRCKI
jgi:hypothetical protein